MTTTDTRYRVNRPRVIAQEIDGEVVAIHLETGNYYSLLASGPAVWAALEGSAAADEIVERLTARYDGEAGAMREPVTTFLTQLEAEGLIVPDEDPAGSPDEMPERAVLDPGERSSFAAPLLEKFDDMQDLILLDPVHEVTEEQGWPHPK